MTPVHRKKISKRFSKSFDVCVPSQFVIGLSTGLLDKNLLVAVEMKFVPDPILYWLMNLASEIRFDSEMVNRSEIS